MPKAVNKVIILGRLGKDPDLRYTGTGTPIARLRIATSDSYKDSDGNWTERTDWHSVVAWGKLGEVCNQYLVKGDQLYVEGKLQSRSFEDANGNTRWITEVRMDQMVMLASAKNGATQDPQSAQPAQPAQPAQSDSSAPQQGPDGDLPF